jgi:hypothetical protein
VAIGSRGDHVQVVRPPSVSIPVRVPLATASTPSGVVISNLKVALSLGWSLAGNQLLAPSGSDAT